MKVVFLRPGIVYGPSTIYGLTPRLLVGEVYRHKKEKMEFVWSDSLAQNTIHASDLTRSLVSIAAYALPLSRSELLAVPGLVEVLPTTLNSNEKIKSIEGVANFDDICKGAVFTVVDDGETDQKMMAKAVGDVVGVEVGFAGRLVDAIARLNFDVMVEYVNVKVSSPSLKDFLALPVI